MPHDIRIRFSLRSVMTVLGVLLGIWAVITLHRVLVLFFVAVLLAVAISGLVGRLEQWRVPRSVSIMGVYLVIIMAMVGLGFVLVPMVNQQITLLRVQLPNLVREPLRQGSELLAERFPALRDSLPTGDVASQVASQAAGLIGGVGSAAISLSRSVIGFLIDFLVVLVIAFFLVSKRDVALRFVTLMTPPQHHERLISVTQVIGRRLGRWVWAQMVIATFYAVCFGTGLWLLGVPYAVALGVIGGILELVPYVGGFMATIVTMIVAFTKDPSLALWVLGLHLVVGNIEVHVIAPKVMGHAVETHPVIAILALFSGIELLGVIGAVIAIPLAVVGQSLVEEFWIKRIRPPADPEPTPSADQPGRRPRRQAKTPQSAPGRRRLAPNLPRAVLVPSARRPRQR
ncbi:MAG TPA: AI-2E family transporter [Herpetosiphonaceae bacterium]